MPFPNDEMRHEREVGPLYKEIPRNPVSLCGPILPFRNQSESPWRSCCLVDSLSEAYENTLKKTCKTLVEKPNGDKRYKTVAVVALNDVDS